MFHSHVHSKYPIRLSEHETCENDVPKILVWKPVTEVVHYLPDLNRDELTTEIKCYSNIKSLKRLKLSYESHGLSKPHEWYDRCVLLTIDPNYSILLAPITSLTFLQVTEKTDIKIEFPLLSFNIWLPMIHDPWFNVDMTWMCP